MQQRPFRYGPSRRRSALIVAGVVLASAAFLTARRIQSTGDQPTYHDVLASIEAQQIAQHGPGSVKVTIQPGADATTEDVQRCQSSGRVVVIKLTEMSETSMPRASCVDPKHLDILPRLPWVSLTP